MIKYNIPTAVCFGEGSLIESGYKIKGLGKKALIVTHKDFEKMSSVFDDLIPILKKQEMGYVIFDDVPDNPTFDSIRKGADTAIQEACDVVVGIGGGSALDAAKAISLVAKNQLDVKDITYPKKLVAAYPIVAIPTTAGTGSEATPFSVLTDSKNGKKGGIESELMFPTISFVDPKYTLTMGASLTRNTAVDALSHLLEGIYSTQRNSLHKTLIYEGVSLIYNNLIPLLDNLSSLELRTKIMQASLHGGVVIAHSSTTLQHAIGNPLTTEFGVPHGLANGIVMKSIMDLYYPSLKKDLDDLFSYLKITRKEFTSWLDSLNMSLISKLTEDFKEKSAAKVMQSGDIKVTPVEVSEDIIKNIYREISV